MQLLAQPTAGHVNKRPCKATRALTSSVSKQPKDPSFLGASFCCQSFNFVQFDNKPVNVFSVAGSLIRCGKKKMGFCGLL